MLTFPPTEVPSFLQSISHFMVSTLISGITDVFMNMGVSYVPSCERVPQGGFAFSSAITCGVSPVQPSSVSLPRYHVKIQWDPTPSGLQPWVSIPNGWLFLPSELWKPVYQSPAPCLLPGLHLVLKHLNYVPLGKFFNISEVHFLTHLSLKSQ